MVKHRNQIRLFGKIYPIVSEVVQRDRENTLYLYVEIINHIVYLKFGEAFKQSIWDRYNQTGNTQHSKIIKVWSSEIHDKYIHRVLRKTFLWAGDSNPLNTSEAYIVNSKEDIDTFISTVDEIVTSKKIGPDFYRNRLHKSSLTPRKYQANIIENAKKILNKNNRVLINLSTRAGKSFISLKLCKDMGASNILILTPFPSAEDSFRELGRDNIEFKGYKYTHLTSKTTVDELCDKNIIFCSYQFYNNSKTIIKEIISSIKFDFVILDECHNTSDSERTVYYILSSIRYNKLIYMSGTPFNDIYSGYFNKDEIVTFDFIDFIKYAKRNPSEINLPSLNIKSICNLNKLQEYLIKQDPSIFNKADGFNFDTIFSDEQHAESFFKWLLQPIENQPLIINRKRWFDLGKQKKIIAFFSTTKQAAVACRALKKYYNGKVCLISGVEADTYLSSADEETINKFFNENENAVILTCGKLTTGVTIQKLDTVWYFKSNQSAEQFVQILFRTMTPCEDKTEASMYCFDTEASLRVVKEYVTTRLDEKSSSVTKNEELDTFNSVLSEIFSCINFTYLNDKFEFVHESVEDYFKKIHNLPYNFSIANTLTNFRSFDGINDIGTECLNEKDLIVSKSQDVAIRNQCNHNNKLHDIIRKLNSKDNSNNSVPAQSEKVVRQVLKLLINIDKKILINSNIKSYTDLEYLWPSVPSLAKYRSNFIQLLKDNKTRLNQLIEDVRYKQETNLSELLTSLSFSNQTDMKTPDTILETMTSKLSDTSGVICDPCCGVGTVFEYTRRQYHIPKNKFYGIEIEPDNVKICHLLGYKNVIQGDATDTKSWNKLINILNKRTNKVKFDHIIMNPPYCRNLYLKILNEAIKHSDDIVNLSPNFYEDYKKLSKVPIASDIEIINREDASTLFNGIQLPFNLSVQHYMNGIEDKHLITKFTPKLYNIFKKLNLTSTFKDKFVSNYDGKGIFVPLKLMTATWDKNKNFIVDKIGILNGGNTLDGVYYKDARNKNKDRPCGGIYFNTMNEASNFIDYTKTKFFTTWVKVFHTNSRYILSEYPFMPTYSHSWNDNDLYTHFELTPDEIKLIEEEADEVV